MKKYRYRIGIKIIINLPQYSKTKMVAKVVNFYNDIYELKLYKEVLDPNGNIKTVLFLPKSVVHKNSKSQPAPRKRKPLTQHKYSMVLENPDPDKIAYAYKYKTGKFAGEVREIAKTELNKREDRVCEFCQKEFPNSHPAALRQHIYRMHTEEGKYETWGKDARKRRERAKRRKESKTRSGNFNTVNITKFNCAFCGTEKEIKTSKYRARMKRSKTKKLYCSLECVNKDRSVKGIKSQLFHDAVSDAGYKCQNCEYDLNYDYYYIKAFTEVGFKNDLSNIVVLCKNCKELWKIGDATIDPETKKLVMKNEESEIDDFTIDMDEVLSEIGDVDDLLED
jgi:hypothetical protein